jgi:hypothetical protein
MTVKRPKRTERRGAPTWLVLCRDVSDALRVDGEPSLRAVMVLDMGTGLVRAVATAPIVTEAVTQALEMGLAAPVGDLPPGPPDEILCEPGLQSEVTGVVERLVDGGTVPAVRPIEPPGEAQDIFDSLVGHLSGRHQPADLPSPSDWLLLYARALDFYRAAPWTRWHDQSVLALQTSIEGTAKDWAVTVLGSSGVQHGLVLYPGGEIPAGLASRELGRPVAMPAGTVALMLDAPSELPSDLLNKALRYGWPPDADLVPVLLRLGREGGGDPAGLDTHLMAVALAAVTAHDKRGPVAVGSPHKATTGEVLLGNGTLATFSIKQMPSAPKPGTPRFRIHQAGFDLVPLGTPVVLGHLSWASLKSLRAQAGIHRPFPAGAPQPAGTEVALLAILADPTNGAHIAAKVAALDPYGVSAVAAGNGQEVFVLAGANGAQVLMEAPADSRGMADFRRRMRTTRGLHAVLVADEATSRGEGTVYGLFECHQPLSKGPGQSRKPRSAKPSKRRK